MEVKFVEDPKINETVNKIIEELKNDIVSRFNPKSIIITGSFGKGEAIVIEEKGKLKFLSDCEVILVPYRWFNRKKLDEFEKEFYKRTGLKVEIWGLTTTIYLSIPFMRKRMRPSIANYDLKHGSKVIYGKNYLEKIPDFKPEDIPIWEGVKLMLNRMVEALEYFSPHNTTDEMVFWIDKIVLACQDAMLLTVGKYHHSYKERNKLFIESLDKFNIPSIQKLANFAIEATNRRLKIVRSISKEGEKYWFQVRDICEEVLGYVVKVGYNLNFFDWIDFQKKYMNSILKDCTSLPFNNTILQNFYRFLIKLSARHKLPNLKMLMKMHFKWDHMLYSHIPLLYFGLREGREVNSEYIRQIITFFKKLGVEYNIKRKYSFKDWEIVKNTFVACWHSLKL